MAPGHHSAQATCEPERSTPSKSPPSILWARSAWQFPSAEFGAPLKLQPQPGSQLQNSRYVPESFQSAISDVALADYLLRVCPCGEPTPSGVAPPAMLPDGRR